MNNEPEPQWSDLLWLAGIYALAFVLHYTWPYILWLLQAAGV